MQGILLLFDVRNELSFNHITSWLENISQVSKQIVIIILFYYYFFFLGGGVGGGNA